MSRSAKFSRDRKYRYVLVIEWDKRPKLNFLMLNPSTADEVDNDPTVERCERRARMWGCGGVVITNIFAYRSTNPQQIYREKDPIGAINDAVIFEQAVSSEGVICGWGQHGQHMNRGNTVASMLRANCIPLYYLKLSNTTGQPYHPLYLPYSTLPTPWL